MSIADTVAIKKCIEDVARLERAVAELQARFEALIAERRPATDTLRLPANKNARNAAGI